jgi:segregation and condensation protein B
MKLTTQLESLLFITNRPLTIKQLSELTAAEAAAVQAALVELAEKYNPEDSGVKLVANNQEYQLLTNAETSELTTQFIKQETTGDLTPAQLEALTVIAYRGPVSKAELEIIRGVNCTLILRNLMIRGLVECNTDKKNGVVQYSITFDFLKHLGLSSVRELPDYDKLNQDENLQKLLAAATQETVTEAE